MVVPESIFPATYVVWVGWLSLILFPRKKLTNFLVLLPTAVAAVVFTIVLIEALRSPNPPHIPVTFGDWVTLLQDQYAVVCTVAHFSVCDLWLGRWMTHDFWKNYSLGNRPLGRLLFSALLVATYLAAPAALLFYFLAKFTVLKLYVKTPQERRDENKPKPVAWEDPLLDQRKVRFDDNWPTPLRQISYAIQFVLGIASLLFMLVAWLAFAVFAFVWTSITAVLFYPCRKHRKTPASFPEPPVKSPAYLRNFAGRLRLFLLRFERRGPLWHMTRRLLQFGGFLEYIPNGISPIALFSAYKDDFGTAAPFCDGLLITDRNLALELMQDPNVMKRPELVGWEVSKSQATYCKLTTIFLPTVESERYLVKQGRALIHTWLQNFPLFLAKNPETLEMEVHSRAEEKRQLASSTQVDSGSPVSTPKTPVASTEGQPRKPLTVHRCVGSDTCVQGEAARSFVERLLPRVDSQCPETNVIYEYVGALMFALMTGGAFKQEERTAYAGAVSKAWIFLPSWFNFLAGGYMLERQGLAGYNTLRAALARYRGPKSALKKVFEHAATFGIPETEALRLITVVFTVAGSVAPAKLSEAVVKKLWEDEKWVAAFDKDPVNFIKECARLDKAVPTVNMFSQRGWTMHQDKNGKLTLQTQPTKEKAYFVLPENTAIHCSIVNLNRDPAVFTNPNEFDPTRKNLDQIVTWNGLEQWVASSSPSDRNKAPRACPGHDIALQIVQYVAQRMKPDWKRAREHKLMSNDLYHSYYKTLDIYSKMVLGLMKIVVKDWNSNPPNAVDMVLPAQDHSLDLIKLDMNKFIPTYDEELPEGDSLGRKLARVVVNSNWVPFVDNDAPWASHDHAVQWRRRLFPAMPEPMVYFGELSSNEAMSRLAFFGMACQYTRRVDPKRDFPLPEGAVFVNDVRALEIFKVRKPYERYGAAAYFNQKFEIVGIYWSHAKRLILPNGGDEWRHAKYVWRSTFFALTTIKDHLLISHLTESNVLTVASRENLSLDHKLRVFLKPFTFHAVSINMQAAKSLINQRGLVSHIWAFEYDEFLRVCAYCYQSYRFKLLPDLCDRSMRDLLQQSRNETLPTGLPSPLTTSTQEMKYVTRELPADLKKYGLSSPPPMLGTVLAEYNKAKRSVSSISQTSTSSENDATSDKSPEAHLTDKDFPFYQDAQGFFSVVRAYVWEYLTLVYPSDEQFHADAEVQAFIEDVSKQLGIAGVNSRPQLANVLAQLICNGTAVHQHVGQISDYMLDPTFIGCKLLCNQQQQSVQTYTQVLALAVLTGLKMPRLMDDWAHLIRQGPGTEGFKKQALVAYKKFKRRLTKLETAIEQRNTTERRYPFHSFNPQLIDTSVSV